MNINYKQPQFELFPANSATLEDVNKPKFMLANLTLSIESLVILSILGIMVALFAFSLGVERGKHLAAQALDERVSAAWNVGPMHRENPFQKPQVLMTAAPVLTQARNAGSVSAPKAVVAKPVQMQVRTLPLPAAQPAGQSIAAGGNWTIQVATYKSEEYAQKEALDFKAKGYQPFLMKKGEYWLVCIGKYPTVEGASAFVKKLPGKFRGSQIRRF